MEPSQVVHQRLEIAARKGRRGKHKGEWQGNKNLNVSQEDLKDFTM
jgi:hypothetical protein